MDKIKMEKTLALFDLDYTLLDVDSEEYWSKFLVRRGQAPETFLRRIEAYYKDYEAGSLDFLAYQEFFLSGFVGLPMRQLLDLRKAYLDEISGYIRPWMQARLAWHRSQKHVLLLISASNHFTTQAIAKRLRIEHVISTQAEMVDGRLTGKVHGIPSYRDGKVTRLKEWLRENEVSLTDAWAYSDSHNDLPLLHLVEHPVAVTPDAKLAEYARQRGWEILLPPGA